MERLMLAVVDNVLPAELVHSVRPVFLWIGEFPEPVGRWIERLLCSAAIIRRVAFRVARNPEAPELELKVVFTLLQAGERRSGRRKWAQSYKEDDGEFEDFPLLGTKAAGPKWDGKVRVVELTAESDPLLGREPMVEVEDLSMGEVEEYVNGGGNDVVCLGNPGLTVSEWTLSLSIVKDEEGASMMRKVLALAEKFEERCDLEALGGHRSFQLHRRIPRGMRLGLALEVEYEGWSGWVMVEWLSRKASAPLSNPLNL